MQAKQKNVQTKLGENIKRLRKEKGWSQTELAKQIKAHLTHINRIETGKYTPALETIIDIARILEVPIDYLVNSADGSLEEVKIEDQTLADRMKLLNSLDDDERQAVIKIIDAMLTKKKMMDVLADKEKK